VHHVRSQSPAAKAKDRLLKSREVKLRLPQILSALLLCQVAGLSKTYSDVEYSRHDGQSLSFDARVPDGPGEFPAVIVVHGGAWVAGDRRISVQPILDPIAQAGIAWFSISYRLANLADADLMSALNAASTISNAVEDVREALTFVRAHAAEYHVDPNRIILIGESAGAQLVSLAALKPVATKPGDLKPAQPEPVTGVVAFYSPSDLANIVQNSPRIPSALRDRMRGTPLEAMILSVLKDLSPINWVHENSPPFLLVHGTGDMVVPFQQSVDFCRAVQKTGSSCQLYPVEGGGHGMRWWESRNLTSYKPEMIRWLRERLGLT